MMGRRRTLNAARAAGSERGALLMEVMLALVIFVLCALAILALVDRATDGVRAARDTERAANLARSAMARIEAGEAVPQALSGPVRAWGGDESDAGAARGWELEVSTEPAPVRGLTLVRVTALRKTGTRGDHAVSYTLRQFVRLGRTQVVLGDDPR